MSGTGAGGDNGHPPPGLERIFGHPVPAAELEIWASIPPAYRDKALQRLVALDRYERSEGAISAKEAAADAGVKLGRFYQMARAWSERRSLASVGTFASTTQPRQRIVPEVARELQAAVVQVVASHPGASVAALARRLAEATGIKKSPNTLRLFVERELRRVRQNALAGFELEFDCSATSLRRPDGTSHVVFLVLDGGTGLILGHSIGKVASSAAAYAQAASHSLDRIVRRMPASAIWAERTERSQLVPGSDAAAVTELVARIRGELGGVAPQVVRPRSYGRYARARLGLRIGPVRLHPTRTEADPPPHEWDTADGLSEADAFLRIGLAVSAHNTEVLAAIPAEGETSPPGELVRMLELMTRT